MYKDIKPTTPPTLPIVDKDRIKDRGNIEVSYQDDNFDEILMEVSLEVENKTGRKFRPQVWTQYNDCLEQTIQLKTGGFNSIAVKYYDEDNTLQTIDPINYFVSTRFDTITFNRDYSIPATKTRDDAVQIVMTWTTGDYLLWMAKSCVTAIALDRYRNRESNSELNLRPVPDGAADLIEKLKRKNFI